MIKFIMIPFSRTLSHFIRKLLDLISMTVMIALLFRFPISPGAHWWGGPCHRGSDHCREAMPENGGVANRYFFFFLGVRYVKGHPPPLLPPEECNHIGGNQAIVSPSLARFRDSPKCSSCSSWPLCWHPSAQSAPDQEVGDYWRTAIDFSHFLQ